MTYPPPYGHPGYPAVGRRPTNSLAIASLVCAFLFAPLGVVFGHMSLSQIRKTGEEGRGLAIAGLVIGYVIMVATVVVVIVSIVAVVLLARSLESFDAENFGGGGVDRIPHSAPPLPPFDPPATLGANCQYLATTEPPSRPVTPPEVGRASTTPAAIPAVLVTDVGDIGLTLDNAKAPCAVRNFTSLAGQHFFDDTRCHRLSLDADLRALQCGDPSGTGTGGPGYRFPGEYPGNQFRLSDPALRTPMVYPRGTLAMANIGPGTNGSQFFLIYDDSLLPPTYPVFGRIDAAGLAVLDTIAAAGVSGGGQSGRPAHGVTIESVRIG
ncbi:peptidylprolyl isomerase [Mycobacterium sp. Y57]|uniref:peptidylprolyl isomerase n=1 Tax=Mycolicibacterium xanthum TaxID=2796469 RepID=UPI001C860DD0|nr:peptidylprolyl isomerase [Mycolicibacterium xanthum]MBX7434065.1 peptidylprolyl isomerase [Mycolicibacterium xanthum]